jgi:glycine C-acetyltransferase
MDSECHLSVLFVGTQDIHTKLEKKISDFYGTEDTILYAALMQTVF